MFKEKEVEWLPTEGYKIAQLKEPNVLYLVGCAASYLTENDISALGLEC